MAQRRAGVGDRRSYWRSLIEQWQESGETQEAFCESRGVAVASLRWWKWKLGSEDDVAGRRHEAPAPGPAFVPVRIVERDKGSGGGTGGACFELLLPGRLRLRVPRDFEAESLARLLEVLGRQPAC